VREGGKREGKKKKKREGPLDPSLHLLHTGEAFRRREEKKRKGKKERGTIALNSSPYLRQRKGDEGGGGKRGERKKGERVEPLPPLASRRKKWKERKGKGRGG